MRWIPIPPDWTELIATSFDDPQVSADREDTKLWTLVDIADGHLWIAGGAGLSGIMSISDWPDAAETFRATWWLNWKQIRTAVPALEVLRRTGRVDVDETSRLVFGGSGRFTCAAASEPDERWQADLWALRDTPWIELVSLEVDDLAGLLAQVAAAERAHQGSLWLVGDSKGVRFLVGSPDEPYPAFQCSSERAASWRGQVLLPRDLLCAPRFASGRRWCLYRSGAYLVATVALGNGILWYFPSLFPVDVDLGLLEVKRRMVDIALPRESSDATRSTRAPLAVSLFSELLAALPSMADGGQMLVACQSGLQVVVSCVGDGQEAHLVAQARSETPNGPEALPEKRRLGASAPLAAAQDLGIWLEALLGHALSPDDVVELGWVWPDDSMRPSDLMLLGPPPRVAQESTRFLRDRAPVEAIKELYHGACQVCGYRIVRPDGSWYAEAHHLWPLEHGGLDVMDNLVVVCPTHHRELDLAALIVDPVTGTLRATIGAAHPHHGQPLRFVADHTVDPNLLVQAMRCLGRQGALAG